jgi:hypothetical protein
MPTAIAVRDAVEDALAAWRQGVRCACGNPLWVAGSAVAGYGCFRCITGSAEPDGDPEIDAACERFFFEADSPENQYAQVSEIIKKAPPRLSGNGWRRSGSSGRMTSTICFTRKRARKSRPRCRKRGNQRRLIVPIHKWLFCPISALREKFYPRNINYMPPVKFFARLDLDQNRSFLDGH